MKRNLTKCVPYTKKEDNIILNNIEKYSSYGILDSLANASVELQRPYSSVVDRYYKKVRPTIGKTLVKKVEKKVIQKSEKTTVSTTLVIPENQVRNPVTQETKLIITFKSGRIEIEL